MAELAEFLEILLQFCQVQVEIVLAYYFDDVLGVVSSGHEFLVLV